MDAQYGYEITQGLEKNRWHALKVTADSQIRLQEDAQGDELNLIR